jgi:O-antigen/teichoic acid export membrane protein
MASLRRATSNIAAQVVSLAAGVFDRIVLVGLLLREWGAETFADYAIVQSWAALLLMVELGAQIYFQNEEQRAFVRDDKPRFRRLAAIHFGISLAVVSPLILLFTVLVASGGADGALRVPNIDLPTARWILWLLGVGNLLSVLRAPASAVYSATGEFAHVTLISAGSVVVNTLCAFAAVSLGARPLTVAALYFALYGVGAAIYFHFGVQVRRAEWTARPALPTREELFTTLNHVKWFALQMIAPTVWLQTPVLVFAARGVVGSEITAFLLMRTMVNQIRQTFQFAAVGAGLEIATFSHAGDFARAWELTAQVGRMTTVISGAFVGGILAFGPTVTYYWAGDAKLYDPRIALAMLTPLLAVAPLQQPVALLQYANRSREIGLLRLGLIVFGPLGCVAGQALGGPPGLAAGLGIAEMLAYGLLAPRLAAMPALEGFVRYFVRALGFGAATAVVCLTAAWGLESLIKPATLPVFAAEVVLWGCVVVLPLVYVALPAGLKRAARARVMPAWPGASR